MSDESDGARRDSNDWLLNAIVENIPNMIFVKDAERLAFTVFNRAGEELLGLPREQLIGRNDYDFFPAADAKFFQEKDRETLKNKVLVEIAEEPLETKNGRRWLHTRKVPILDDEGEPRYLLGISEDITDRKSAEAAIRAAKAEAEAASAALESFAYSVAHDLRTPLRAIDGYSQALIDDYGSQLDADGKRYLDSVCAAAQRMAHLIDALLTISRLTRYELRRTRVDMSSHLREKIGELRQGSPERTVDVRIAEHLVADADPRLVGVALDHLAANAWKFTSKKASALIEIGTTDTDRGPAFFVRDDGVGFDMKYVDKLFGPFQRLHSDDFPGSGIGLAMVERAIRRHGGRVWAEGAVGMGATFYFTLE